MAGYSGYCRLGFRRNGCGVTAVARSLDTTPFGLGRNKTNIYFKLYSHGVNKYRPENMKHKKHSITQYLMVFSIHWATMRAGYKMVPVSSLKKCPVFNVTTSGGVHRIDQGCSQGGVWGLWGSEYHWCHDVIFSFSHCLKLPWRNVWLSENDEAASVWHVAACSAAMVMVMVMDWSGLHDSQSLSQYWEYPPSSTVYRSHTRAGNEPSRSFHNYRVAPY